jgi:hypothetical protein
MTKIIKFFPVALILVSCVCHAKPISQPLLVSQANENVIFFVRDQAGGTQDIPITIITAAGATIVKRITKSYNTPGKTLPACGSTGNASFSIPEDWHIWFSNRSCIYPTTVYEAGSVRADANTCTAIEVSNLWACPLAPREDQ